jgi:hypothetical protein
MYGQKCIAGSVGININTHDARYAQQFRSVPPLHGLKRFERCHGCSS